MTSSGMRVFGIGLGNFVELRATTLTPRARISKWVKKVGPRKKITLRQVFYVGGRVIGYTRITRFVRLFGLFIDQDKMIELDPKYVTKVLSSAWRRSHL